MENFKKLACACTVAWEFGVCTHDSKYTEHKRHACHKLALGLPHYMCGVTTGMYSSCRQWIAAVLQLIGFFMLLLTSITWKSYWRCVVLPNMLGYPCVVTG